MPELLGAARLRELLRDADARPTRSLGQNFVVDPNTIRKVVDAAGIASGDRVIEIGAGTGALTLGLAAVGAEVVAVEVDRRLIPALEKAMEGVDGVKIVHADALSLDYGELEGDHLVGNLPYNIAAQIVLRALEEAPGLRHLTVMTQREVGERLASGPGSKVYGQTSVLVAYHGHARVAGRVSRNAFFPVPTVDSVIVRVDRSPTPPEVPWDPFRAVVRAAFAQRRKMLRGSLGALGMPGGVVEAALVAAGVAPTARAEELDLDAYLRLTATLEAAR